MQNFRRRSKEYCPGAAFATHRRREGKTRLAASDGHIAIAHLPAYAPKLNPVETIRAYLKQHEMDNFCLNTTDSLLKSTSCCHCGER